MTKCLTHWNEPIGIARQLSLLKIAYMIRHHTIRQTTLSLVVTVLTLVASNVHADKIPTRAEQRAGQLVLSESLQIQMTRVVAGFWGRKRFTLLKDRKIIWQSLPLNANINVGSPGIDGKFLRIDLDKNGRSDWLALLVPGKIDAASSYGYDFDGIRVWSDEESRVELMKSWQDYYCSALTGLIVLDDESAVYAFNVDRAPDPFMHRNPYVQGEAHYKNMARGVGITGGWSSRRKYLQRFGQQYSSSLCSAHAIRPTRSPRHCYQPIRE